MAQIIFTTCSFAKIVCWSSIPYVFWIIKLVLFLSLKGVQSIACIKNNYTLKPNSLKEIVLNIMICNKYFMGNREAVERLRHLLSMWPTMVQPPVAHMVARAFQEWPLSIEQGKCSKLWAGCSGYIPGEPKEINLILLSVSVSSLIYNMEEKNFNFLVRIKFSVPNNEHRTLTAYVNH